MSHPPEAEADDRLLAALAYLTTWLGGVVVLLLAGKHRHGLRWHAWQAIGIGLLGTLLALLALALTPILFAGELLDGTGPAWYADMGGVGIIAAAVAALVFLLVVACAVAVLRGRRLRVPIIARLADRRA